MARLSPDDLLCTGCWSLQWKETLFAALATTLGFYLVFQTWLEAQLPRGLAEFLRGPGSWRSSITCSLDSGWPFSPAASSCASSGFCWELGGGFPGTRAGGRHVAPFPTTYSVSPVARSSCCRGSTMGPCMAAPRLPSFSISPAKPPRW